MRYVVLDTETTGLEVREGHRIIEVGCVELLGRQLTNRHFHQYVNPGRPVDPGAFAVHGISDDMLADKPQFAAIAQSFLEFVRGSTLVIHNAAFDLGFLNREMELLGLGSMIDHVDGVVDSLLMAREMFPGKRNNLDALCDRLGVNNAHRQFHGALLDSQILGEVYLAMTRGQDSLVIELSEQESTDRSGLLNLSALVLPEPQPSEEELQSHESYLKGLDKEVKGRCMWNNLLQPSSGEPAPTA